MGRDYTLKRPENEIVEAPPEKCLAGEDELCANPLCVDCWRLVRVPKKPVCHNEIDTHRAELARHRERLDALEAKDGRVSVIDALDALDVIREIGQSWCRGDGIDVVVILDKTALLRAYITGMEK